MRYTDLTHLSPDEALRVIRRRMSEREFQERVEALLTANGWHFVHIRDARRQNLEGFPDLLAVKPGRRILVAELKTARGKLKPAQAAWLQRLAGAGATAFVWRPEDLDSIKGELA